MLSGYLDPENFLGGRMKLDVDAARAAMAPVVNDLVTTVHDQRVDAGLLVDGFADLRARAESWLADQADPDTIIGIRHDTFVEARYVGQSFQIQVRLPEGALAGDLDSLTTAFHAEHERLYNHSDASSPVEILQLRLRISGELPSPTVVTDTVAGTAEAARTGQRPIRLSGQVHTANVFDRSRLAYGATIPGPAIVEQEDTTILVPDGFTARVNEFGDLVISKE